jgi:WD40 repeat protein
MILSLLEIVISKKYKISMYKFIYVVILLYLTPSVELFSQDLKLVIPEGHSRVNKVHFNNSEDKIITISTTNEAPMIWDVKSGRLLVKLEQDSFRGNTIDAFFSKCNRYIICCYEDGLLLRDIMSYSILKYKNFDFNHFPIDNIEVSKLGNYLILFSKNNFLIYDINNNTLKTVYNEIETANINSFTTTNDEKYIITGQDNNENAIIWDHNTGIIIKNLGGHKGGVDYVVLDSSNKYLVTVSKNNIIKLWDVNNFKEIHSAPCRIKNIISAKFSNNSKFLVLASPDSISVLNVTDSTITPRCTRGAAVSGNFVISPDNNFYIFQDSKSKNLIQIWRLDNCSKVYSLPIDNRFIEYFLINKRFDKIIATAENEVFVFNLNVKSLNIRGKSPRRDEIVKSETQYGGKTEQIEEFCSDIKAETFFSVNSNRLATLWDFGIGRPIKNFSDTLFSTKSFCFNPWNNNLLTIHKNYQINLWNSENGELISTSNLDYISDNTRLSQTFSDDGSVILISKGSELLKMNANNLEVISNYDINEFDVYNSRVEEGFVNIINDSKIEPGSNNFIFTNQSNKIEYRSLKDLGKIKDFNAHIGKVLSTDFNVKGNNMVSIDNESTLIVWNLADGSIKKSKKFTTSLEKVEYSKNDKFIILKALNGILVLDETSLELIYQIDKHAIFYDHSLRYIITAHDDKNLTIRNINSGVIIKTIKLKSKIKALQIVADKYLLTSDENQKNTVWEIEKTREIYNFYQFKNQEWLTKLTEQKYYMCSKDASRMLHYVSFAYRVIGFEQLDPVYNRPDIIVDSIGKNMGRNYEDLVSNYYKMWEKRISYLGLDKAKILNSEISVPIAEIIDANSINYENNSGFIKIRFSAEDKKYRLKKYNILINEVPFYGAKGIDIEAMNKFISNEIVIPLNTGRNKIQVSVLNEVGLENYRYPIYVDFTPEKDNTSSKTYFFGLGVNNFKDKGLVKLSYCVKDVKDLAAALGNKSENNFIYSDSLVNRERLGEIKKIIQEHTTIHDRVIISCSSHGIKDSLNNFYLATHDINLSNPSEKGIRYEELVDLLDSIPARKKLLLIDACNSGEDQYTEFLIKDYEEKKSIMDSISLVTTKGVIEEKKEENLNRFIQLSDFFVNTRNATGSVIVSAAGGQQHALEAIKVDGKKIENGAFTYSVLEYLNTHIDNKTELTVNKLKKYVESRVEEITKGKQKPTSRQETMEIDWNLN